jgi:hypothetical protein
MQFGIRYRFQNEMNFELQPLQTLEHDLMSRSSDLTFAQPF